MPSDLIKKSKATLRKHAKLSPPPQPPSPSSLPAIGDSISDLNPSSSNTLCRHCKLKLLRGLNSMICIYCGACQQAGDISLKPIGFHSTSGYRLLLKSLELDPEDRIGVFFEENRRNKSGTPVEEGISLAELLDVQIEWRDDPEKHETGSVEKTFDHIRFLNISNFATGSGRDSGSDVSEEEEQSVNGENDPSDAYEDQENLSLFENDAPIETASVSSAESRHDAEVQSVTSGIYNDGNSLFGDDADIETLNTGIQNEESENAPESFDLRSDSSSGRDADMTQNEDTITGLSRGSSADDMEVQSLNSKRQDEDSEAVDVSFGVRDDSIPGREADIQFVNSKGHGNEDSNTNDAISSDLKRDSLSEEDKYLHSVIKTAALSSDLRANSLSRRDSDVQSVNSSIQENEDINTNDAISSDLNRKSSFGRDPDIQLVNLRSQENDDSDANHAISSDLKRNSSFDDDKELHSVKVKVQNEDTKAAVLSSDSKGDSLFRRDTELLPVKVTGENEDFKSNAAIFSDLGSDSSSRHDESTQFVNSKTQENEDSSTNSSKSSDVRRDTLSGDNTEVETVDSTVRNEDSETSYLSSDLRVDSLPRRDAENDDVMANTSMSSDLNKDNSSGDDTEVQSVKSRTWNEHFKTADLPSDIRSDSLSRHDAESESVNTRTQENEEFKTTAATSTSSDMIKDSASGDDTEIQSLDSRTQNQDPEDSDLRGNSLSRRDSESDSGNSRTQNEEPNTNFASRDDTEIQNFDSKISDVSQDGMEVYSVETSTRNEDSETADISSDLRNNPSFKRDAEFESVNSRTQENEDTKIAPAMSYDFKRDSSQDNKDSSGDDLSKHDAFQRVSSKAHDEDSKTNAAVSSNLNRESSFKDDSEILTVKSRMQNDDSETADVSSDLRSHSSFRNNAETRSVNSRKQIEDSETDLSRDYSFGNDAESQSSYVKNQNNDSKTAVAVSPDTRKDYLFEDDIEIQSEKYRLQNDNSKAAAAISSELDSYFRHDDSKTAAVSSDLRFDSSSELESETQRENSKPAVASSDLRRESSSRDNTETRPVNSTKHTEDSKSEVHMDLVSGYMEEANKDKPNSNLDPIDKD